MDVFRMLFVLKYGCFSDVIWMFAVNKIKNLIVTGYHTSLIIESAGECNIAYIQENTDMTRSGLKTLLKRLVDKGLINKQGQSGP